MALDLGTIGALSVAIGGDTSGLNKALGDSDKMLGKHAVAMRGAITTAAKYAAAAAAAGVAVVAALVTKSMVAIDAQAKLARQLNATNFGLETIRRAADLAGVETEKLMMASKRLQVVMGEALQGEIMQAEAFTRLGVSAAELSKMDIDQRIIAVNEALLKNVPAAERAAVAGQLFGNRMGTAIAAISAEDVKAATEEVRALGLAVSQIDSDTIERANDALSTISEVIRGMANRLAVALAPIIERLAVGFRDTAIETEGWKNEIEAAIRTFLRGVGFVADALHGIKVLTQVVADTMIIAFATVAKDVEKMFGSWTKRLIGMVPFVGAPAKALIELFQSSAKEASVFDSVIKQAKSHIEELLNMPLPSEKIAKFFAETTAKKTPRRKDDGGTGKTIVDDETKNRLEALREALRTEEESENASHFKSLAELQEFNDKKLLSDMEFNQLREREFDRHAFAIEAIHSKEAEASLADNIRRAEDLEALRQSLLTEEQLELEAFDEKKKKLIEAEITGLASEAELQQMREDLAQQHEDRMFDIASRGIQSIEDFRRASWRQQAAHMAGMIADMTAGLASGSRKMFAINKIAGIANVGLKIPEAAANAYAWGSAWGGPPGGAAMAALAAVAMLAQMNQIRSASFGGGGGGGAAPSLAGSTPATPVTPVSSGTPGRSPTTIINLQGEFFTRKQIRSLLEQINDGGDDGGKLIFT